MKRWALTFSAVFAMAALVAGTASPASAVTRAPVVDTSYVEGTDVQAFLFNPLVVNRVDLTMTPVAEQALRNEPRVYQPATLKLTTPKGVPRVYNVGIHIKGQWGSYRSLDEKTGFKIKVDFSVPGQAIYGIKKFTLNNMVQDTSMLHEAATYRLFRAMQVPAPRVGYANVFFNGNSYGLHANIETYDLPMLSRWFPHGTKHLYEGAYGVDVGPDMQVDEGSTTNLADITALANINNTLINEEWFNAVLQKADIKEMTMNWAIEHYIGHWDGYTRGWPNNFYVHLAKGGRFSMHPWGTDQTWVDATDLVDDGAGMMTRCMQYEPCNKIYIAALAAVAAKVPSLNLPAMVDRVWAVIAPHIDADPRKSHSLSDAQNAKDATKAFMSSRYTALLNLLGNRALPQLGVSYPTTGFTPGGALVPKLSKLGTGVLTFTRLQGEGACAVNPTTGKATVIGPGTCQILVMLPQTDTHQAAMAVATREIPMMTSRLYITRPASLRVNQLYTVTLWADSQGAFTLRATGACKVLTGRRIIATKTGTCQIKAWVSGDDKFFPTNKTVTVSVRT